MMHIALRKIFYDIPQRFILDSLIFNIYLLYFLEDCAGDTTIYMVNEKKCESLFH